MTLVKLHPDAFSRFYDGVGYIVNQFTRTNNLFDINELDYLKAIARIPRDTDDIVADLQIQIPHIPVDQIKANFCKLVVVLENEKLVVTGESLEELKTNESVAYEKPYNILEQGNTVQSINPAIFFYSYFDKHPTLFASQIDLTSHCNFTCRHCFYPPERIPVSLDTGLVFDVLDQLAEMGTLIVTFSGGEPLLHKDFGKILLKARRNDFIITIQSNAFLVDERVTEYLREANVCTFQTSLYSMKPDDHDRITGLPGSLKKTLQGIELVGQSSIPICVGCHVMKSNRHSYMSVLEWSAKRGVRCMVDFFMMARSNFCTENLGESLNMKDTEEVTREMLQYENKYVEFGKSIKKASIDINSFRNKPICDAGKSMLYISSDGDCYPCAGFVGYNVGNVRQLPVKDIWNNSDMLSRLRSVTWNDFPECLECEAFQYCSMCFARNFNENKGNMLKHTSHQCDITHLNMRVATERWFKS